ncbi:hypothetical protein Pmani_024294 [Petrolisthes manimaculis]|uniref:Uncharacterized protein n=1 Tax=Petrolisthes manimaculis TaxID=1843537 RepID=A0AAE1P7U8_9EUCA|nr:hypothetical protein Pmani_024294 [Petrolisthes manimaculis]
MERVGREGVKDRGDRSSGPGYGREREEGGTRVASQTWGEAGLGMVEGGRREEGGGLHQGVSQWAEEEAIQGGEGEGQSGRKSASDGGREGGRVPGEGERKGGCQRLSAGSVLPGCLRAGTPPVTGPPGQRNQSVLSVSMEIMFAWGGREMGWENQGNNIDICNGKVDKMISMTNSRRTTLRLHLPRPHRSHQRPPHPHQVRRPHLTLSFPSSFTHAQPTSHLAEKFDVCQ